MISMEAAHRMMLEAHAGQVDKSGLPYHTHPERVAALLKDAPQFVQVAALLHDTLEDTALTVDQMLAASVPLQSMEIIHKVTRRKDETYAQFIERIAASGHEWAIRVKLADLTDNMSRPLPPELEGLHRRYAKAKVVLTAALEKAVK